MKEKSIKELVGGSGIAMLGGDSQRKWMKAYI